jgi:hypothetical protein
MSMTSKMHPAVERTYNKHGGHAGTRHTAAVTFPSIWYAKRFELRGVAKVHHDARFGRDEMGCAKVCCASAKDRLPCIRHQCPIGVLLVGWQCNVLARCNPFANEAT